MDANGETLRCPRCGEDSLDDSVTGLEPICKYCGVVVSENHPTSIHERAGGDEVEESLTWSEYYNVHNSTEQQIAAALSELEEIGDLLGLEVSVRERAAEIYAEAATVTATDGRPTGIVIAAAIVHAARLERSPRPLGCVAGTADVEVKSLSRIVSSLPIEVGFDTRTPAPAEYLPWLCSELQTGSKARQQAMDIADGMVDRRLISGMNPVGIAAAAIYLSMDGSITQRTIAQTAGITEETIRVRVSDCREAGVVK